MTKFISPKPDISVMPQKKRKYPSNEKTTTEQGYREYHRFQMRARRKEKKQQREQAQSELLKVFKNPIQIQKRLPSTYDLIFGKPKK